MLTNMPMMAQRHIIMSLLGEIEARGRSGEEQWAEERSNVTLVFCNKSALANIRSTLFLIKQPFRLS